ncbi:MAG: hypothetical protein HY511_05215 [Actinobacteria bacterium]|nr:hypothetical protein [Actinomycetota bacterium]
MKAVTVAVLLATLPLAAAAQEAAPRPPKTVPLELRRGDRPEDLKPGRVIVHPAPTSDAVVRQAERDAAEAASLVREERLLREQTPRFPMRPDLGYDVQSGIQQRNLQRSLRR